MKSETIGSDTSKAEVLNVSPHGFWLFVADREYFLGFDDFPWADFFRPRLTTIAQPVRAFGEQSVKLLLDRMNGHADAPPRRVALQGRLVVRGSCRALAN